MNDPIINPTADYPKEHIAMKAYRLKYKDKLGEKTIDILFLNDHKRLVIPRFEIGSRVIETLEKLYESMKTYTRNITPQRRSRIIGGVRNLLSEAQPNSEYSATVATVLLNEENYSSLKLLMQEYDLWSDELQSLEDVSNFIALDYM